MSEVSARIARYGVSQEPRVGRSFLAPVILALDGGGRVWWFFYCYA